MTENLDVVFAEVPASVDVDPRRVPHTDAIGGHIFVRKSTIAAASEDDSAHDIALFQLDHRVGSAIASPVHPAGAGGGATCGDSFDGTLVGFGKTSFTGGQPRTHMRNYHDSDGWEAEDTSFGNGTYANFWTIAGVTFDQYTGALGGDSGGALLDKTGRLCGIISRYAPVLNGFPVPLPSIKTDTARLESLENSFWISNILVDPKTGDFRGECANSIDADHDSIPDACDNCPPRRCPDNPARCANLEQQDSDHDGIGDVCDNCDETPNDDQSDVNYSDEVALNGGPPRSDPSASYLTDTFPGDACDDHPITVITGASSASPRDPSVNPRNIACRTNPPETCGDENAVEGRCVVSYGNGIYATSFIGGSIPVAGLTRVVRCACPSALDDASCKAMYGCDRDNLVDPPKAWMPMTIVDDATGGILNPRQPGQVSYAKGYIDTRHTPLGTSSLGLGAGAATPQSWGWAYWLDVPLPPPRPFQDLTVFDGIVWSWVKAYTTDFTGTAAIPASADPTDAIHARLRQSVTRSVVGEVGEPNHVVPCPIAKLGRAWTRLSDFGACPMCGGGALIGVSLVDPNPLEAILVAPGFDDTNSSNLLESGIAIAMVNPRVAIVLSTESPAESGGPVRGEVIDVATHAMLGNILAQPNGGLGLEAHDPKLPPSPAPLVAAMSGARQELAFFGEPPSAGGRPSVRVYDFDLGATVQRPIVGPETLGTPYSAAYRVVDDSYYLLDRDPDTGDAAKDRVRLVRLGRGMNVEVLGSWVADARFSKFALTAGRDTTIVVSSSSATSHAICELATDGVSLKVGRKVFGAGAIEVPAFKTVDGQITFARRTAAGDVLPDHVSVGGVSVASQKGRGDEAASAADCF